MEAGVVEEYYDKGCLADGIWPEAALRTPGAVGSSARGIVIWKQRFGGERSTQTASCDGCGMWFGCFGDRKKCPLPVAWPIAPLFQSPFLARPHQERSRVASAGGRSGTSLSTSYQPPTHDELAGAVMHITCASLYSRPPSACTISSLFFSVALHCIFPTAHRILTPPQPSPSHVRSQH